jgi:lipoyl(octanoyl) transferase
MIRTAAEWGVAAERNPVNRGIWVGNSKMGSIGIAIRRGITYHGLAFKVENITTSGS